MYIKNKLGIYVYPDSMYYINNISCGVNSICHEGNFKDRLISNKFYGFKLIKESKLK